MSKRQSAISSVAISNKRQKTSNICPFANFFPTIRTTTVLPTTTAKQTKMPATTAKQTKMPATTAKQTKMPATPQTSDIKQDSKNSCVQGKTNVKVEDVSYEEFFCGRKVKSVDDSWPKSVQYFVRHLRTNLEEFAAKEADTPKPSKLAYEFLTRQIAKNLYCYQLKNVNNVANLNQIGLDMLRLCEYDRTNQRVDIALTKTLGGVTADVCTLQYSFKRRQLFFYYKQTHPPKVVMYM